MRTAGLFFACLLPIAFLSACGTLEDRWWQTGVRREQIMEIKSAIRSVTSSAVTSWTHAPEDPPGQVLVWTANGDSYVARQIHGTWHFTQVIIL